MSQIPGHFGPRCCLGSGASCDVKEVSLSLSRLLAKGMSGPKACPPEVPVGKSVRPLPGVGVILFPTSAPVDSPSPLSVFISSVVCAAMCPLPFHACGPVSQQESERQHLCVCVRCVCVCVCLSVCLSACFFVQKAESASCASTLTRNIPNMLFAHCTRAQPKT